MKKTYLISSTLALLVILGGTFLVRGIGQPDDIALSDRFTSSFLQEDLKTDEGFHFFESQNGHYSMWYPEGFYLQDEPPSYISKDHYELLNLYEDGTDSNGIERHIQIRYESGISADLVETNLNLLLKDTAYNDEYIELDHQGNKIFHGSSYQIIDEKNVHTLPSQDHDANRYFALVVNQNKTKHISVYYRLNCLEQATCKIDTKKEESFFETFINHIEFR
ncbi:hypothetical protein [Shouchella miscanthi]|uniref:hypothetical protein n=1 Tax=Shouchella miscanthi TaxID=2598861 RepID=UPI001643D935|nr:hypothetical protein [Shouchella miscanthi]